MNLRNAIALQNEGLVIRIADRWAKSSPIPLDDLIQIGWIGLLKCLGRVDSAKMEHPKQFSTYLGANIDGEIKHYLRDRAHIVKFPRRYQEISSKAKAVRKVLAEMPMSDRTRSEFAAHYNCDPAVVRVEEWHRVLWVHIPGKVSRFASKKPRPVTDTEVAREMGIALEELHEAQRAIANRRTGSLSPEAENIPQLVECPHKREQQEEWGELYFALERLPEGDRYLLHQHYFEEVPLSKLAKQEGVSVEIVKDRLKGAIGRAREMMEQPSVALLPRSPCQTFLSLPAPA